VVRASLSSIDYLAYMLCVYNLKEGQTIRVSIGLYAHFLKAAEICKQQQQPPVKEGMRLNQSHQLNLLTSVFTKLPY
jgi:hypothetical protein